MYADDALNELIILNMPLHCIAPKAERAAFWRPLPLIVKNFSR